MTPTAVRNAATAADEMILRLAAGDAEMTMPTAEIPADAPADAPIADGTPSDEAPAAEQPADASVPAQPPTDSGVRQLAEELAKAEQRYNSLQGMFAREQQRNARMEEMLANLTAPAAPQPAPDTSLAEDNEKFGPELVEAIRRQALAAAAPELAALKAELAQYQQQFGQLAQVTQQTRMRGFIDDLAEAVDAQLGDGAFQRINFDDGFKRWLEAVPTRVAGLSHAKQMQDIAGVLDYFVFYDTMSRGSVAPQQPAAAPPSGQNRQRQLERQVAPGTSRGTPTRAETQHQGEKRQWTRSAVAKFYTDKANKRLPKGTDADAIEREIFAALRENRVDNTK